MIIMLLGAGFVVAAEIDDSSLFVEAFSAYQKNDFLLTIEKIKTINQLFPDTPLRDVALLLLARSGLKSGDNELAATAINLFNAEYADNPLKSTIEEELLRLGNRRLQGEKLLPTLPLRSAAQKLRFEQLARDTSAADENEQERPVAGKTAQDPASARLTLSISAQTVTAGQRGEIPFELVNLGRRDEEFVLETNAPPEYETKLEIAGKTDANHSPARIGTTVPLKGIITFRMPPDKIDGQKAIISLRVVSQKNRYIVQAQEAQIITAAPLVRVIVKTEKQKLIPSEETHYRITVMNVGSLPARKLVVRVLLPAQLDLLEGGNGLHTQEADNYITFKVDELETGRLSELTLNVKVREDSPVGQEMRSRIEVVNTTLQTKDSFTSTAAVVVQATSFQTRPLKRP